MSPSHVEGLFVFAEAYNRERAGGGAPGEPLFDPVYAYGRVPRLSGCITAACIVQLLAVCYLAVLALMPLPRLLVHVGMFVPLVSHKADKATEFGSSKPADADMPARRSPLALPIKSTVERPHIGGLVLPVGMASLRAGNTAQAILAPEILMPPPKRRIAVSQGVQEAKLLYVVQPEYPWPAIEKNVRGRVVVKAIIAEDGSVQNARAISGDPLLVSAALDAIKKWRYSPTYLNREPIEVETTIYVDFKMPQPTKAYHPRKPS
jgi:TonB family protein